MNPREELLKRVRKSNEDFIKQHKPPGDIGPRIMRGSELKRIDDTLVSTGNTALDKALGGGIPEGTMAEISGHPGIGKSVSAALLAKQIQNKGKYVIWYISEGDQPNHSFQLAGLDMDLMFIIKPMRNAEDCIDQIRNIVMRNGKWPDPLIGLIVIDSVSSMAPAAEIRSIEEKGTEQTTMARLAAMMSYVDRSICGTGMLNAGAILLTINQERVGIHNTYTTTEVSGGNAQKYYPKIKIRFYRTSKDIITIDGKDNSQRIGHTVSFDIIKNNTGTNMPGVTGKYKVLYGQGIDQVYSIFEEGLDYGTIKRPSSAYYQFLKEDGPGDKINGKEAALQVLKDDIELQKYLEGIHTQIRIFLRQSGNRYMLYNGEYIDMVSKQPVDIVSMATRPSEYTFQASEEVLARTWGTPEEDKAWGHLQDYEDTTPSLEEEKRLDEILNEEDLTYG